MAAQLCVALDGSDRPWIEATARALAGITPWVKVGLEAFTAHGPALVQGLGANPAKVFLDLKLHDIPNTVARATANCASLGVDLVNVHAAGGADMMRAAADAVRSRGPGHTRVIAVTVLTSLDGPALARLGLDRGPSEIALRWAVLARECGLDGVVCSVREAIRVRAECGPGFFLVTPGIRPRGCETGDQKRFATPAEAARAGVDLAVIGRPVTQAVDPAGAAASLGRELRG